VRTRGIRPEHYPNYPETLPCNRLADQIDRDDAMTAPDFGDNHARRETPCVNDPRRAQFEIVGKAVILTDGKAGTVDNVWRGQIWALTQL
jgi:hypothetical protein